MHVKAENESLKRLKLPEMDSVAEFSSNNVANVTEENGRILIQVNGFTKQ